MTPRDIESLIQLFESGDWTAMELRAQTQALPKEGGVPVGPTGVEPYAPPPPPSQPTVVYYPVPVPGPPSDQPAYQGPIAPAYPVAVPLCPHCYRRHRVHPKPSPVRIVPTSPWDIGPMAIQKSFPPISPLR